VNFDSIVSPLKQTMHATINNHPSNTEIIQNLALQLENTDFSD